MALEGAWDGRCVMIWNMACAQPPRDLDSAGR